MFNYPGVHRAPPVNSQPHVVLKNWAIKEMVEGKYFVGDHVGHQSRASTAIVHYDEVSKCGTTRSGRVYELTGREGLSSDGEYVWDVYKRLNSLTEVK